MAHLLRFGQSGRSVDFATPITAPTSSFSLEYTVAITNTAAWQSVFFNNESLSTNTAGSFGSQRDSANNKVNVWFTLDGKARVIYTSSINFTLGVPFTIRIEWSAATSQIRIFQDGTLLTTYNGYSTFNIAPINGISRNSFQGDLYAFKIIRDGVTYDWNTSASNGQGTSLIDTASGNNGTIVGGATYVYYNSITTTGIPNNTLGAALNQPCAINLNNYFTGATSYSVLSGSLPAGLSIVGNEIVGTPTTAQSTTLVIRASNSIDVLNSATITFNTGLWYLQFPNNVDSRITLPTSITAPTTQFRLELDFSFASTGAIASYLHSNTGSSFDNGTLRIDKNASNELIVITSLNSKGRVITTVTGAAINTRMLITIEWDSTSQNIVIKRDTTTIATLTGYTAFDIAAINTICTNLNSAPFDLYGMKVTSNNTLVRNYDPNTSGGVGNLLIDRVSNQNGTQAGTWPADNAEWVSYAPAGGDVIGVGIGSSIGDGFDFSRATALILALHFTAGDSFDLSRLATALAARNYSTGDSFDLALASARVSARNLTPGDGFDLPRLSASLYARNLTAGGGFGYGQAQFGAVIVAGEAIGFTLGDGFDRSMVSKCFAARQLTTGDGLDRSTVTTSLTAQPVPTYGIPVAYANATVRASISTASVADGSCLARAAIGPADMQLAALLEPTARGMFRIDSSAYVLSSASIYTRANVSGKTDLVPIEYRRHAVTLKPKSFEAANSWTNRQFTTSGSTNTRTRYLTL